MTLEKHGKRRNKSSGKGRGKNKQHGSSESRRKSGGNRDISPEKPKPEDLHVLQQEYKRYTKVPSLTSQSSGMVIEKQPEVHQETKSKFQKRKIESNWDKYEDFTVNESEKSPAVAASRGADLRTLLSQPGGAAAQLRLKDETWDEPGTFDEAESEIDDLFKVDFKDVADRLQAIPLYERLGVPQKYFEKDVIDKINADAAYHAERIQAIIDKEKIERSARLTEDSKLSQEDRTNPTRDSDHEQLPESAGIGKSCNAREQRTNEVRSVTRDSENVTRTVDSVQYELKSDIDKISSSATSSSTDTSKSPRESNTLVPEHTSVKGASTSECVHQERISPDSSKMAETPADPEAAGSEEDVDDRLEDEDWLDDFLNEEN